MPNLPDNPFIIGHHADGAAFADRIDEVARIEKAFLDSSARLIVYGDRRLGKSSALHVAAMKARAAGRPVVIADLGNANTMQAAAQRVLGAVHREVGQGWRELATNLARRLRGSVTVTPSMDSAGTASVGFTFDPRLAGVGGEPGTELFSDVLDAVEEELARRNLHIGLGLDEFQRLHKWCGEDVEWALKASMERHRHIGYVLAGSARTLIGGMITNKKRALWKIADALAFEPLDSVIFDDWIIERADDTGLTLTMETASAIVTLAGPRTRDVVQLARVLWDHTHAQGTASPTDVARAMEALVAEQDPLHRRVWELLSDMERQVLLALAADATLKLTATHTLEVYRLGAKSSVHAALISLTEEEILLQRSSVGSGGYTYDDPFFRRWVQVNGLEDLNRSAAPLL